MTDAEIVVLVARAIHERFPLVLKYEAENLAGVAVAALTEAGRLVPEGHVCIDRGRWERVLTVLSDCSAASVIEMVDDAMATLAPGDLDADVDGLTNVIRETMAVRQQQLRRE